MKITAPKKERTSGMLPQTVLMNWMEATKQLLQNYNQLINLVESYRLELQVSPDHAVSIGQCPLQELLHLVDLFERELETLLSDINKSANQDQPASSGGYKMLIAHTQRLQQLNRQAEIRLQVANQSAS